MSLGSFIKKTKAHSSNPGRRCVLGPYAKDVFKLSALGYTYAQNVLYLHDEKNLTVSEPTVSRYIKNSPQS